MLNSEAPASISAALVERSRIHHDKGQLEQREQLRFVNAQCFDKVCWTILDRLVRERVGRLDPEFQAKSAAR